MLKRQNTPSIHLTLWKTLLVGSAITLLTACGGKTLNTKNAETFDASLKAMTADLDELDRRKVAAAVMLLTDSGDITTMTLNDVQGASNQAGGLLSSEGGSLFGSRQDILGEMIISAEGRLNGKSAKGLIETYDAAQENGIALDLAKLNTALETITADETAIEARKVEIKEKETALKEKEQGLIKKGHAYGRNFKLARIRSATSRGIAGHGHATFKNIGDIPINRPAAIIEATLKSDKSIIGYSRLLNPGYDANSNAIVQPGESQTFRYDFGFRLPMPEGTKHTKNADDYTFNVSLAGARNANDKSAISFRLNRQDSQYSKSVPKLIKRCDSALESVSKRREAIKGKIDMLESGKIDDLPYLSLNGNFKC